MMVAAIDSGLAFFREVLALRGYRQEILSADVANASTPGFKALDLDFAAALDAAGGRTGTRAVPGPRRGLWLVDDARHLSSLRAASAGAAPAAANFVKYQSDSEVTLDGNSVDLDHEKVAAAENAVQYEAAATFTTQTIRMLMLAITGSGSQPSNGG
ncbi:MAG: flagellar basal body rod protein FlgB [Alphaproteobacteria bacterium]|nr:flagellar basal body rod protein FlgB [Alphaproteobacteria bacterium]